MNSAWHLSLVTAVFLFAIALINEWTAPGIAESQTEYERAKLREVTGPGIVVQPLEDGSYRLLRDGQPTGWLRRVKTDEGYNGSIELMLATNARGEILGVRVTKHQETPGLGDKLDPLVDPWIHSFEGRSFEDTQFELKPEGDFDSFTGASITPRAVVRAVGNALKETHEVR